MLYAADVFINLFISMFESVVPVRFSVCANVYIPFVFITKCATSYGVFVFAVHCAYNVICPLFSDTKFIIS